MTNQGKISQKVKISEIAIVAVPSNNLCMVALYGRGLLKRSPLPLHHKKKEAWS